MKKCLFIAVFSAVVIMALKASATTLSNAGPLTISWKVSQGTNDLDFVTNKVSLIKKGTNVIGTNTLSTYKSKISTSTFKTTDLIALLADAYSYTNLVKTDKLVFDGGKVYLVDKTGTNILLTGSPVLTLSPYDSIASGAESETVTSKLVGTNTTYTTTTTGAATKTEVVYVTLSFVATNIATSFTVSGVATGAVDVNLTKGTATENYTIPNLTGIGTLHGTNSIIEGTFTGSAKGSDTDE
jgi:hypothetical protein